MLWSDREGKNTDFHGYLPVFVTYFLSGLLSES